MWRDKHYYPGHVVSKESSSKYAVAFDDGDMRLVEMAEIIVCDMLAIGQVRIVSLVLLTDLVSKYPCFLSHSYIYILGHLHKRFHRIILPPDQNL